MSENELDIPASNREIALHLRGMRADIAHIDERMDGFERTLQERRFRAVDILMSHLLYPIATGIFIFFFAHK